MSGPITVSGVPCAVDLVAGNTGGSRVDFPKFHLAVDSSKDTSVDGFLLRKVIVMSTKY